MTTKKMLVESILKSRIDFAKKQLVDLEKQQKEYREIPYDCLGKDIFNDGIINENQYLREDLLINISHQIGYLTAVKSEIEIISKYLKMTKEEVEESLQKDKETEKENKKYLNNIFNNILNIKK